MESSEFLRRRKSKKGKGGFKWTGSTEDLRKFFWDMGFRGTWSQLENSEGRPHKFTNEKFTCTWYATTCTLQIQNSKGSNKASELKDKLEQALVDPSSAKDESETERTESYSLEDDGSEGRGHEGNNEFNEEEIHDGVNPGKLIANLLRFRMKKWSTKGAKVTIATPFIDTSGWDLIISCLENETALEQVYTREVCAWVKKIDRVIAEGETRVPSNWIASKVVAFKTAPSLHAKFLAGEYKDNVELIVTSCNMTSEHLSSDQLEIVMRTECTVETFHSDWLKPLELMAKGEGSIVKFL